MSIAEVTMQPKAPLCLHGPAPLDCTKPILVESDLYAGGRIGSLCDPVVSGQERSFEEPVCIIEVIRETPHRGLLADQIIAIA